MICSDQLRAGRALADLSQAEVAARAGLSLPTIKRAEANGAIAVSDSARAAIAKVLEAAGVIFIEQNGEGPGVRLRK
ncbi:helix-turn-helix transcriptional regulator [Methylobacterium sp. 10]|uniref:helix-turn-helix domain-containing protein n=1 Tax=Methylobacterium sp. 10 TaxID=1101191 RepID=UPI0004833480|nr:helix-turn-helix transcriptional regulator [Methylobacterium sp. 10]